MVHFRVTECTLLAVSVLREYLYLYIWELAYGSILQRGVVDQYRWKLITSGECNSKSAYNAFFMGRVCFLPWTRIWKTPPPPTVQILENLMLD
jgi:hypothetical protein